MADGTLAEDRHDLLDDVVTRFASGYRSIGEMVYGVIKEGISNGALAPGARLRQEALAETIGVSRVPVRSALIQLESEGLVSFHPRRGAVVRILSVGQVEEIYELRALLEGHALAKAVRTMTEAKLDELRVLAARVDKEHEGGEFLAARAQFYGLLYDAEANPQLLKLIDELRASVGRYLLGLRVSGQHGHHELVEIVGRGDVEAALDWLNTHLASVRDAVASLVAEHVDQPPTRTRRAAATPRSTPEREERR